MLPGASRQALPWTLNGAVLPGYAGDSNPDPQAGYQQRNDWVMGPGGVPVISGSSEQQGYGVPSPGFDPVDPGVYGGQYFAGRQPATETVAEAVHPILQQLAEFAARGYVDPSASGFGQPETPALWDAFMAIINGAAKKKKVGTRYQVPT